jgi:HK97 family phage portal protein
MPPTILPPSRGSVDLNAEQALTLTAVYRSVQIIGTFCSQMPIGIWRNGEEVLPTPAIAVRPDFNRSRAAFIKRTVTCLALNGNAYWRITRDNRGAVTNLEVLDPTRVAIKFDEQGRKFYDYADLKSDNKTYTFNDKEVQHLRLSEVFGSDYGLGPVQSGRRALSSARDVRDYAGNWFANGGAVPRGVLKTDQKLTDDQYTRTVDGFEEALKYSNSIALLEAGLSYESIVLSPADALWLEAQKFSTTDIARLFGIPATYLLAEVDSSNFVYTNLSQVNQVFYNGTLMAYLGEIEDAFTQILPNRQEAAFKTDSLLRTDDVARYTAYNLAITGGYMTPEYVADKEGLPTPPEPKPVPAPLAEPNDAETDQPEPSTEPVS